ncbi:hypothetical protein K8B33_10350 [Alcanivorax sp. JB21]|uniref:hypothetical protein n=1 Tax=Alcanivorax limicola TaxID=2874102 RepID=UPI001CBBB120|nr:hypothetical protein [Alcanivorax limicola]MBZ2189497.1 hypothetical protein [Alcanivorax limicola]
MKGSTPHAGKHYDDLTRRIFFLWIAIMVVAPLAMAGAFYLLFTFPPTTPPAEKILPIPPVPGYTGMLALFGLFLLGTRPLTTRLLAPERLSAIRLPTPAARMTTRQEVALRVQTGTMMLLGIIDLPIILALCLSYLDAEIGYALLAIGYGLLSTAMTRPDLSAVARQLEQRFATTRRDASPA